jgi:electron transport complex protein RnfB
MLTAILVLGGLGLIGGIGLVVASRVFYIEVDPRIDLIDDVLPGANCGGCGYPGCRGYAEAVVKGKAGMTDCAPGGSEAVDAIANVMGVEAEKVEPKVAVVLCSGDQDRGKEKFIYDGIADCRSAHRIGGGHKICPSGCLGLGTCSQVCPFDAVIMTDKGIAVIDAARCTGCGNCVEACPRSLIKIFPKSHRVHVLCSNREKGARVKKYCSCGCIGCKLCAKESKHITMDGLIAVVTADPIPEAESICEEAALVCTPGAILDDRCYSHMAWATDGAVRDDFKVRAKAMKKKRKAEREAKKKAKAAEKEGKAKAAGERAVAPETAKEGGE